MIADLYDFDKTVFPKDSTSTFWLFCLKRHPAIIRYLPKQILSGVKYFFKKISLVQFKEEFFCFLKAIDGEKEAEAFWDKNGDKIYSWFNPKENDAVTIVCSASPEFEIRPILERLGADIILGTKMDVKTGKITGENCKGKEKVKRITAVAGEYEFRNAYSDNPESDAPMLSLAENRFLIKNGNRVKL